MSWFSRSLGKRFRMAIQQQNLQLRNDFKRWSYSHHWWIYQWTTWSSRERYCGKIRRWIGKMDHCWYSQAKTILPCCNWKFKKSNFGCRRKQFKVKPTQANTWLNYISGILRNWCSKKMETIALIYHHHSSITIKIRLFWCLLISIIALSLDHKIISNRKHK